MLSRINKSANYSINVTEINIKKLYELLKKDYQHFLFSIDTVDWSSKQLTYEELYDYDNYDDEKITRLNIHCQYSKGDYDNEIEISFWNRVASSLLLTPNINYTIKSNNSETFKKIQITLDRLIYNEFRVWGGVLYNFFIFWIFVIIISLTIGFLSTRFSTDKIDTLLLPSILAVFLITLSGWYEKLLSYFFPKSSFSIWKQKDKLDEIYRRRNLIFVWIILAIILSIGGNYLSKLIGI